MARKGGKDRVPGQVGGGDFVPSEGVPLEELPGWTEFNPQMREFLRILPECRSERAAIRRMGYGTAWATNSKRSNNLFKQAVEIRKNGTGRKETYLTNDLFELSQDKLRKWIMNDDPEVSLKAIKQAMDAHYQEVRTPTPLSGPNGGRGPQIGENGIGLGFKAERKAAAVAQPTED